ncbi:hypothetical protein SAMN04487949_0050 [Halogranum gelatinilyticum]|uniref:Uncharacterized protein n=1 Tax=Halogranum gelatinilyticum TaxID=660521 RepID=A0A1G9NP28_9EURY|nr:hypothetical protein [Halogranum gelatinilyticum]SDL88342.1 hypothetical protein SAMN04487949_0050 [Halogranum gelatinilyticum]
MQHAAAVATLLVATVVLAGCSGSPGPSLPAPMVDRVAGTTTADTAETPDPEPVAPASATADGSQVVTVTTPTATAAATTPAATVTAPPPSTGTQTPTPTAEACLRERGQDGLACDEVEED